MNEFHDCQAHALHTPAIEQARSLMPQEDVLSELVQTFKIFGDATRIKILTALAAGELCVCDIAVLIGASQSTVSHQLRLLRAYRLVRARRDGKSAFYTLADDHVLSIMHAVLDHVQEEEEDA